MNIKRWMQSEDITSVINWCGTLTDFKKILSLLQHTQFGNFGSSPAFGNLCLFLQKKAELGKMCDWTGPLKHLWSCSGKGNLCLTLVNIWVVCNSGSECWTRLLMAFSSPLVLLGFLPLHHQSPCKSSSFCAHVCRAAHLLLPAPPALHLEMIFTKNNDLFHMKQNHQANPEREHY